MLTTFHTSIHDFSAEEWNTLARGDFVFARHEFFTSLEDGGCLGRRTGWYPRYIAVRRKGVLIGALPLYNRSNSYGEYIFDWAWANAAAGAGLDYYPKLTAAIPFTPATGQKFLLSSPAAFTPLVEAAREEYRRTSASSLHFLFITPAESAALSTEGFAVRSSYQYHWRNRDWRDFEDFLSALRSKRRTEIRRERAAVASVPVEMLTGAALTDAHASIMYEFYSSTIAKMGGHAYLSESFFHLLFERMRNQILFVLARGTDGLPIAGALNLFEGHTLFGRYWGCVAEYRNLHFEICYYRTIEWAIANGMKLFEAGAQGEQKFMRGFEPSVCLSAHALAHCGLDRAVREFIGEERAGIDAMFAEYRTHDPFKRAGE